MQLDGPVLDKIKISFPEDIVFSKYPFFWSIQTPLFILVMEKV